MPTTLESVVAEYLRKAVQHKLVSEEDIRRVGEMDPQKLEELREWLLQSDKRDFAATLIRHDYIVLEVERGNSAATDARRVASCRFAVECAGRIDGFEIDDARHID